jgi:hypothetical protein
MCIGGYSVRRPAVDRPGARPTEAPVVACEGTRVVAYWRGDPSVFLPPSRCPSGRKPVILAEIDRLENGRKELAIQRAAEPDEARRLCRPTLSQRFNAVPLPVTIKNSLRSSYSPSSRCPRRR